METFDYTSDFDPDNPVGTTFTQRIREGGRITEYHGEITIYDPPNAYGSQVTGGSFSMVVEYHLTSADGGTQVVNVVNVDSTSRFVRIMGFLFGWFTRYLGRKQLRKLKELVEAA